MSIPKWVSTSLSFEYGAANVIDIVDVVNVNNIDSVDNVDNPTQYGVTGPGLCGIKSQVTGQGAIWPMEALVS